MLTASDIRPSISPPLPRTKQPAPPDPPAAERPPFAVVGVLVIVAIKCAVNMTVASRYGWHRDELYYADAGRHLSLGYVDFPPATPWLARLSLILFGPSLVGLRFLAVLAGSGVIVITALITSALGGGRWAQILAALSITPLTLGSNALFQTVSFDQLAWALVLWAAVWLLREGGTRRWLIFGATIGAAWMTKFTVGVLIAGLAIGLVTTRSGRNRLRGPGPWLALLIAGVITAPNIWWQARHGWPSIDFFASRSDGTRADNPPQKYLLELVIGAGVAAVPVWVSGLRRLVTDRHLRPIGIAVVTVLGGWLALGGKAYYAAPALIAAFAAGAVHLESRRERTATASCARPARTAVRRALPVVIVATTVLTSPFILPVASAQQMVRFGLWHVRDDYAEQLGWPELVATVSRAWRSIPPSGRARTAIVVGNYGEAGALDRWGPPLGLPPVVSGALTHRYWTPSPQAMAGTAAILVGFDRHDAHELCDRSAVVARISNRAGVDNQEAGGVVRMCDLRGSIGTHWRWLASS